METQTEEQIIVEAMSDYVRKTLRSVSHYVNRGQVFTAKSEAARLAEQLTVLSKHYDSLW